MNGSKTDIILGAWRFHGGLAPPWRIFLPSCDKFWIAWTLNKKFSSNEFNYLLFGHFPCPLVPLDILNAQWAFCPFYRPTEKSPQAADDIFGKPIWSISVIRPYLVMRMLMMLNAICPLDPLDPMDIQVSFRNLVCPLDPMDIQVSIRNLVCPMDPMNIQMSIGNVICPMDPIDMWKFSINISL